MPSKTGSDVKAEQRNAQKWYRVHGGIGVSLGMRKNVEGEIAI